MLMMDGEQEKVEDNLPAPDTASQGPADEMCQKMESIQLENQPTCDSIDKTSKEMTLNDYKKKVEHLETIMSDKQSVLDDLKQKYNESIIKLQQLEKANRLLTKEKAAIVSSSHHPGGDLCVSPLVTDIRLQTEIRNRDYEISELREYVKQYYDLVIQANEEKENLSKQLRHSTSLNNKLKLQANDLVQEKDVLYEKLSDSQSSFEAVMKEREELKEKHSTVLSPQVSDPGANIEQFKAQLQRLKTGNDKLSRDNDTLKQHVKEQEEKIEKLTLRCGRAEDDLKKVSGNKDRRNHQPTDENNDWRFKSLDERDAKITELSIVVTQQQEEIGKYKQKLQLQSYNTTDGNETFFIKEQLKAFQDDYHAERQEKERILEQQHKLQETNEVLMKQLYGPQFSPERAHYPSQMPPTHGHAPHSRQYPPTQPRSREELAYPNSNRLATHLPGPPGYGNTIPPRGYPQTTRMPNDYYPAQYNPSPPPNFPHEVQRTGNHPENVNRGHLHEPH